MRSPQASMDMMMALRAVGESNDRTVAAKSLGISVSALDKRLKALSRILGSDVIRFVGAGVELTEAAAIYRRNADRALEFALLAEETTKTHLLLGKRKLVVGHSTYLPARLLKIIHSIQFDPDGHVTVEHRAELTMNFPAIRCPKTSRWTATCESVSRKG